MKKGFYRDYAKGKPCQVRIAAECGHGGCDLDDTTVLAHIALPGLRGVAMKVPDLCGAWACHTCHGLLDGGITPRLPVLKTDLQRWHYDGMARTIDQLITDGVLECR